MSIGIPQSLQVQQGNQSILITWDLVAGATSYHIQRSQDNVSWDDLATVDGFPLPTTYIDTTAVLKTKYWYRVAAIGQGSSFAWGEITFIGQPNPGETVTIANVTLTAGTDFAIGGTTIETESNLITAINANPTLQSRVIAEVGVSPVFIQSLTPGPTGLSTQLSSALTNTFVIPFANAVLSADISEYTVSDADSAEIATPQGEVSLFSIRNQAKLRADRKDSDFVTDTEWNNYINQAMYELYDILVTLYEDYYVADPIQFSANGTQFLFDLPNGSNTFLDANTLQTVTPKAFYKLLGVDLALQNANNAYVTVNKFNFIDRNRFVYPNTASTIYGVFNLQYRQIGNKLMFIPTPSGGQSLRVWYIPRLDNLLADTDCSTTSISGWIEYVIVRAAKYALDKEESDSSKLDAELVALDARINASAANRDAGQPDKISDTRAGNGWGNNGGFNGGTGGW